MNIDYPFRIDGRGRTGTVDYEEHIRDMIEQILFTMPGERVNLPDFGCGIMELVFDPNSVGLASSTQFRVQGALQQYIGDDILVQDVNVESDEAQLTITVQYVLRETQEIKSEKFYKEV